MKKLLLLACVLFTSLHASAQSGKGPEAKIEFDSVEYNFGKVPECGKKVEYTFEFTNTGTIPLLITRVATTCKCIDHKFSKKPVPPGGKGEIKVTFNPKKQKGVFYKVIQVFSNTSEQRHILTVRGEVVE